MVIMKAVVYFLMTMQSTSATLFQRRGTQATSSASTAPLYTNLRSNPNNPRLPVSPEAYMTSVSL